MSWTKTGPGQIHSLNQIWWHSNCILHDDTILGGQHAFTLFFFALRMLYHQSHKQTPHIFDVLMTMVSPYTSSMRPKPKCRQCRCFNFCNARYRQKTKTTCATPLPELQFHSDGCVVFIHFSTSWQPVQTGVQGTSLHANQSFKMHGSGVSAFIHTCSHPMSLQTIGFKTSMSDDGNSQTFSDFNPPSVHLMFWA